MLETRLWNLNETGRTRRIDRIPDTVPGLSTFQQIVLRQGCIARSLSTKGILRY